SGSGGGRVEPDLDSMRSRGAREDGQRERVTSADGVVHRPERGSVRSQDPDLGVQVGLVDPQMQALADLERNLAGLDLTRGKALARRRRRRRFSDGRPERGGREQQDPEHAPPASIQCQTAATYRTAPSASWIRDLGAACAVPAWTLPSAVARGGVGVAGASLSANTRLVTRPLPGQSV